MCVDTEKKLQLNIARLCCHNFFIIGGILIGMGGGRAPCAPPGYAYGVGPAKVNKVKKNFYQTYTNIGLGCSGASLGRFCTSK